MKHIIKLAMVLVLALIFSGSALAEDGFGKKGHGFHGDCGAYGHHGPRGPRGNCGPDGPGILKHLNLTDDQQDQVQAIFAAQQDERRANREKLREARKAMVQAMEAVPLDEQAVRNAHQGVADIRENMVVARALTMQKIKGILTPEQTARLDSLKAERRQCRKECRKRRQARMNDELMDNPDVGDGWDAE